MGASKTSQLPAPSYTIQGRTVQLPCVVKRARSGAATFLVSAAAARRLLPTPELEPVELLPGRALLSLACIDYVENDLGDYGEISIAFFVRLAPHPPRIPWLGTAADLLRGRLATYIHRLPVNQAFTCEAGCTIWGFPKVVDEIEFEYARDRVSCTWSDEGRRILRMVMPRRAKRQLPDAELTTYTLLGGAIHRTPFVSGAEGFDVRLGATGGFALELGDHPIADELRSLGLPKSPLMTMWMEHMHARFEAPEKV